MTYPAVDDLPQEATSTLLGVCTQLSQSRYPGLSRWAASVSEALRVRLISVTTGVRVDGIGTESRPPLALLDGAELKVLQSVVLAGSAASDDRSVVEWCSRMARLIVADFYRRVYEQVAIDAKGRRHRR
ncbi:MAG TPA: hypothetical protein VGG53_21150 [Mycobacterium sp.]|uniref:hypothetical protein n=1 Tax=Mycobacterium sp. TaxID=1785 RepID=UPI002F4160E1